MAKIYPVIMSGGAGTRLWPLSRKATPKQYHRLVSDHTMLEETLTRVSKIYSNSAIDAAIADPVVICAEGHEDAIMAQAQNAGIALDQIILEPMGRNTAAVAAIAAHHVALKDPEGLILLLPADHYIPDVTGFWQAVTYGLPAAIDNKLVTLGIDPVTPETGYGYIKRGAALGDHIYKVDAFKEKPGVTTAKEYLKTGNYFWNAGIFLYGAHTMLKEFTVHAAEVREKACTAYDKGHRKKSVIHLDTNIFSSCPADSVDYAIMEKTAHAAIVAPVAIGWNDIGAWSAVQELQGSDTEAENIITVDTKNTYIRSDGPVVATIGVEDLIIIAQGDNILITRNDRTQDVKTIVETLKAKGRDDLL